VPGPIIRLRTVANNGTGLNHIRKAESRGGPSYSPAPGIDVDGGCVEWRAGQNVMPAIRQQR
jgi:hypothetical protein